jgi:hypothetical protein
VQSPEFFHDECLYVVTIGVRHCCYDGLLNHGKRILIGLHHDVPVRLLDHITPGKAQRVRFCQILLDGQILLRRSAFVLDMELWRSLSNCATNWRRMRYSM